METTIGDWIAFHMEDKNFFYELDNYLDERQKTFDRCTAKELLDAITIYDLHDLYQMCKRNIEFFTRTEVTLLERRYMDVFDTSMTFY